MLFKSSHKDNSKAWWSEFYQQTGAQYRYGKEPSSWVIQQLDLIPAGSIVAEVGSGEGRNAVAMAAKKLKVKAFDFCEVAMERAQKLAIESGVEVDWKTLDLDMYLPELMAFDAIVCVNYKMPKTLLNNLSRGLKQNGYVFIDTYLMQSAKENRAEAFECFQPNELLKQFMGAGASFRLLHYSELDGELKSTSGRVKLLAQKTQLF